MHVTVYTPATGQRDHIHVADIPLFMSQDSHTRLIERRLAVATPAPSEGRPPAPSSPEVQVTQHLASDGSGIGAAEASHETVSLLRPVLAGPHSPG